MNNQYKIQSEPDGTYSIYENQLVGGWGCIQWGLDSVTDAKDMLLSIKRGL
jgi:hypothetical protein